MSKKIVALFFASVIGVLCLAATIGLIDAFIKLEQMKLPYVVLVLMFVLSALWAIALRFELSPTKLTIIGAFVGQSSATVSLFLSNFFIPNGIERNLASFERWGLVDAILTDFVVALVLGGWLIGGLAFFSFGLFQTRKVQ